MSANFAELVFFVIFVILVLGFFGNRNRDGKVMSTGCFGFLLKLAGVLGLAMFLFSLFLGTKQWVEGLPYHIGDFVAGLVGDGSADRAYASCLLQQSGSLRGTVAKGGKSVPIATAEAGCFGFSWTQIGKCRESYLKNDSTEPDEVQIVVTSCGSGQAAFRAIKDRIDTGAHSLACTFLPEKQSCEAGLVPRPPQEAPINIDPKYQNCLIGYAKAMKVPEGTGAYQLVYDQCLKGKSGAELTVCLQNYVGSQDSSACQATP